MSIPKKVVNFLQENKEKPKGEVIQTLMTAFNYKKTTAEAYYSLQLKSSKLKNIVFKFLKENPEALKNNAIKKYTKNLGISKTTYLKYKNLYIEIESGLIAKEENKKNLSKVHELDNKETRDNHKSNTCLNQRCLLNKNKKCINDIVLNGKAPCFGKDRVQSKQNKIAFNSTQALFIDLRM